MRPEIIVLGCSHKKLWIVLRISAKFYVQNLWTSFILSQWWGSQQQKILLITDSGTTDTTREALRYQQGAKGSYPASHFCNSFGTKNFAKASGCSKAWKHGRADPHTSLVTFQAVLRFSGEWWLRKQVQQQQVCEWGLVKDYMLGVSGITNSNSSPKSSALNNQADRSVTQIHLYRKQWAVWKLVDVQMFLK